MTRDQRKRVFDLVLAAPALLISVPVQAVVAILVVVDLGRPVFFRQARPGLNGKPFELVKFRTMRVPDPSRGLTDDESRLTSVGRALRSTSLDELPALWNVIRGDMSLVGPRPLLMQYLPRYSPEEARRHDVRPGLTGLAQVSGRNNLSWQQKFALDIEYVERRSISLDLEILARTFSSVLRRDGIHADGAAMMPLFMGEAIPGRS